MERTGVVQLWAGIAVLALCVLIGVVEGAAVFDVASVGYFLLWLLGFCAFLVGAPVAASVTPSRDWIRRTVAWVPIIGAALVAFLSPHQGGLAFILLVMSVGVAALQLSPPTVVAVIVGNSVVVLLTAAGLGPHVEGETNVANVLLSVALYSLLQGVTAAMVWSQERVADALEQLTVAHVELRGTSVLLVESSRERERLRIARELHDVLGHQLSVLTVQLEVAAHHADGQAREHVLRARELAKNLLGDVRVVVGIQRGRSFDLPAALARVVDEVPRPRIHLTISPDVEVEDDQAATMVRAVQEIVTNAIRHSDAVNLWLDLSVDSGAITLSARDDGRGTTHLVEGNGLRGLRERVQDHGGVVHLDPRDGFRVDLTLPVQLEVMS